MGEKIKTKNVDTTPKYGQGFIPSMLEPGNYSVKILGIGLTKDNDPEKRFGDKLTLQLETSPIVDAGFKGFQIDKTDPSKGNYKGRVGYVGFQKWGFKDFQPDGSKDMISRDDELLRAIATICEVLGITESWLHLQDAKYEIDQLIEAFNKEKPFANKFFFCCIAGRPYMNGKYKNYEMYFPRPHRNLGPPFSNKEERVQKFFEKEHIEELRSPTGKTNAPSTPRLEKTPVQNVNANKIADTEPDLPFLTQQEDEPTDISTGPDQKLPWE